jgi:hypothetical protein
MKWKENKMDISILPLSTVLIIYFIGFLSGSLSVYLLLGKK